MELLWEDVEKAHRNLRQIYLYLSATIPDAPSDPALQDQLREIGRLSLSIGDHLRALAEKNGIAGDSTPLPSGPPGATSLDRSKLQSIVSYLEKVFRWLEGARDTEVPSRSREKVGELITIVDAIEVLLNRPEPGEKHPDSPEQPLKASDFAPSGPEAVEVPDMAPLVLEHTFKEPLLRGQEGKFELTQRAVRLIDEFLTSAKLSYDTGERRRLYRQIARWLEATPEGMVLTLRIGGLSCRLEPYPRYEPRKNS